MPNPYYTSYVKRGAVSERKAIRNIVAKSPVRLKKEDKDILRCIMAAERLLWLFGCNKNLAIKMIKVAAKDPNFPGKLD